MTYLCLKIVIMVNNNKGIVIQARTGSTRLPRKMTLPFYKNLSVLDILLNRLKKINNAPKVVVATTINKSDDEIENICKKNKIDVYRGDEKNVLNRFIKCSEQYEFDYIVRVCGDNPFFDIEKTLQLFDFFNDKIDYLSYKMSDGTPTIKTHLGFWGEIVKLEALKKISNLTSEKIYQEHVTNFIYSNQKLFYCSFINLPENIRSRKDIRLTMDTDIDFQLYKKIFNKIVGDSNETNINKLINYIDNTPEIKKIMKKQIVKNSK